METKKRENTSAVTALQVKALQKRLDAVRSRYIRVVANKAKPADTARIAKARAAVYAFDEKAQECYDEAYDVARRLLKTIEDEILFGDLHRARTMIDDVSLVVEQK